MPVSKVASGVTERKNVDGQGTKTGGSGRVFAMQGTFIVDDQDEEEGLEDPSLIAGMFLILIFLKKLILYKMISTI